MSNGRTLDQHISDLWHISRTALATDPYGHLKSSRFAYVMSELKKEGIHTRYFEGSSKRLMFYLEDKLF